MVGAILLLAEKAVKLSLAFHFRRQCLYRCFGLSFAKRKASPSTLGILQSQKVTASRLAEFGILYLNLKNCRMDNLNI
jgi:hypothetical protein